MVSFSAQVGLLLGGAVAEWVRALDWRPDCPGSNPTAENFWLRNFVNSVYPALPVSFGGDTKKSLKAVGPFYLVSMPGEVKDPTSPHWNV